jgi:hypothetical protein
MLMAVVYYKYLHKFTKLSVEDWVGPVCRFSDSAGYLAMSKMLTISI